MEDHEIIELYWQRKEEAVTETADKYGKLCFRITGNILVRHEDCEECVSDTYLKIWNSIPTARPNYFSASSSTDAVPETHSPSSSKATAAPCARLAAFR